MAKLTNWLWFGVGTTRLGLPFLTSLRLSLPASKFRCSLPYRSASLRMIIFAIKEPAAYEFRISKAWLHKLQV